MPKLRSLVVAAAVALTLTATAGAPPVIAAEKPVVVVITHVPLTPTAVLGSGLGTVRTFYVPARVDGKSSSGSYLTGTLTTIAVGLDNNRELRSANLVVVVGSEENQLVIGGLSAYPADGSTIAPGQRTTRPVIGGSGVYDGASGSVTSTNLGERGWRHVFRITITK
ncbi:MAG: hypothetical protein PSX37_05645 [bacterium]|nr:hypothetical protein [bacterium]